MRVTGVALKPKELKSGSENPRKNASLSEDRVVILSREIRKGSFKKVIHMEVLQKKKKSLNILCPLLLSGVPLC